MKEEALFNQAKICLDQGNYEQAIALLGQCIADNEAKVNNYWYLGLAYLLQGQKEKANTIWFSRFLQETEINITDWISGLIKLLERYFNKYFKQEKFVIARLILDTIYTLDKNYESYSVSLLIEKVLKNIFETALNLAKLKNFSDAEIKFKKILEFTQEDDQTWYNLAILYYESSQFTLSLSAVQKALNLDPNNPSYYYLLGIILEFQNNIDEAIFTYQRSIELLASVDAYNNLANCFQKIKKYQEAEGLYRQAISLDLSHCGSYINLGKLLSSQGCYDDAIIVYKKANQDTIIKVELYENWVETLQQMGKIQEAIEVGEQGIQLFPDDWLLRRKVKLLLPILYDSPEEIDFYRHRFTRNLESLIQDVLGEVVNIKTENINKYNQKDKIGITNFYLGYQGKNDLQLQSRYSYFVDQIVKVNYPNIIDITSSLLTTKNTKNAKIKIGYISPSMYDHTVGKLMLGWLQYRNKDEFEISCYYLNSSPQECDAWTNRYQKLSDKFYYLYNLNFEEICKKIIQDDLDILVFLDIGMHPIITQLATLRLAPIQCATWGHPITSASPMIDYFLSSDLMEPEDGDLHYSEVLIRLPNIGIAYKKPDVPENRLARSNFTLREDSIIYLSCQSLFKYLPQYDYLFPEIALQVKNSQFVFLGFHNNPKITEQFCQRLERSFSKYGLNYQDNCVIMPRLNHAEYLNLNLLSDVFLDTLSWSGGNTTLEAIACDLPVVTYPGEFMRGRHSYGILKMLEIEETIASSEAEYIQIAVKLGCNSKWRQGIRGLINKNKHRIYNDRSCVLDLEKFYYQVIQR